MIVTCTVLANSILHETGKAGKNCYRWINTSKRELATKHNLSFGDVTSQIRHRMRDIVIGHRQDRNLCNGALACANTACALVHGGEVTIQIPGVAFPARNLTADV